MSKNEVMQANSLPAYLNKGPARGSENVTANDLVIPRLELVQDLSPAWKKDKPQFIPGAQPGMLYNNVTRELYGESVVIVPVYFRSEVLVWKDRDSGGGFRGVFSTMEEAKEAIEDMEDGDDCEPTPTNQHFCLLLHADRPPEEIVLSCAKTKRKASKTLNSLIRMTEQDSFARMYRVKVVQETNSRSQEYYTLSILSGDGNGNVFVPEDVYRKAEKLYEQIVKGSVAIDQDFDDSAAASEY